MMDTMVRKNTSGQRSGPTASSVDTNRPISDSPAVRVAVLLVALAVLYIRMPGLFHHPQLWGEDNDFLYKSLADGWSSLPTVIAGWLAAVQFLVAILGSYFGPAPAPAIYTYAAFLMTLLVVWMVTSPRLDMPYKPLLGIAVVIVPMGYEELGTLTNIQWILPIGAFVLLFMHAAKSWTTLAAEALLVTLVAFSGAFCIFLSPLFLYKLFTERDGIERRRLALLSIIMCIGAITQAIVLALHPSVLNLVAPTPYSWTVWVNLPFTQFMTTFGPAASALFNGLSGAILGLILLSAAIVLACLRPYRQQKLFMLFFALAIAVAGMFKFRAALETQFSSNRYFYVGGVFALWFICCLSDRRYVRSAFAGLVVVAQLMLLPVVADTPRFAKDQEWPVWASYLSSGLPVIIPTTPAGFFLSLPASKDGPLARFASWPGRNIAEVAGPVDPAACAGAMGPVEPLGMIYLQPVRGDKDMWIVNGTAWDAERDRPLQLVALVDSADRVVGFGMTGFKPADSSARARSGWTSIFYADPGTVRAYGITDDGRRRCQLANTRSFPLDEKRLATEQFAGAINILPNRVLAQRFKPSRRLEGLSVRLVTWRAIPNDYTVAWKIMAHIGDRVLELGAGTIDAAGVRDWQLVRLPVTLVTEQVPDQIEVSFRTSVDTVPAAPVGLPLYKPAADTIDPPADIGGTSAPEGAQFGLVPAYAP